VLPIALLVCVTSSCDKSSDCACTKEIRTYRVSILNANLVRIDSLATRVVDNRSGFVYRSDSDSYQDGYMVMSDMEKQYFKAVAETVIFHASHQKYNIAQEYIFKVDDCQCHIVKVAGPDTIIEH